MTMGNGILVIYSRPVDWRLAAVQVVRRGHAYLLRALATAIEERSEWSAELRTAPQIEPQDAAGAGAVVRAAHEVCA